MKRIIIQFDTLQVKLTRVYDSYHNLGGNDVATELFHRTISLPTDPEKEDA